MNKNRMQVCTLVSAFIIVGDVGATPINYTPVNPNFGGNPANGAFLMQEATANNHFVNNTPATPVPTETQVIANEITNTVLSGIASKIASQVYGEGAQQSGSYNLGNGQNISFVNQNGQITLTITNGQGGISTLVIPDPTL
jgi:curli production assembly/transport component CsgF